MTLRLIEGGRERERAPGLLIQGATEIATMAGGLRAGSQQADPASLRGDGPASERPVVACWEDRIVGVGPGDEVRARLEADGLPVGRFARLDARGGTVTPGLVDPHTHLLFGGSRVGEFRLRQQGAGYLEILAAGGGILSTVAATRAASDGELAAHGRRWLAEMLSHGVTTVEVKSGYGLDVATELRLLEIAAQLDAEGPVDLVPTFLGAHAVPPEYRGRPGGTEAYVRSVVDEQLPAVAAQGIARSCDVFCEQGVFSAEQAGRILQAGLRHGLRSRLHADELAPSGGAELAAAIGALSADHLAAPSDAGIDALAAAADGGRPVVATLLPATSWYLMSDRYAPARTLVERGVPVAIATDFNPGTSPTASLPLVMTIACLALQLSPAEALVAATINAAHALGMGDEVGSLEEGKVADLVVWDVPSAEEIPLWPGARLAHAVVKRGRVVFGPS